MDRKLKDLAKPDENAMLDAVSKAAHQIWQAGLGAFARAQQEGGDLFDKLVQEGGELHRITQRLTGERGFTVTDTVARLAENANRQASGSWDKLEKVFEERVARSLRALGAPSAEDVRALSRDMVELKAALRMAGERSQHDIDTLSDALSSAVGELKAVIVTAEKKRAAKSAAVPRAAAKAVPRSPAKPAASGAATKRAAAKKTARTTSRPA